MTMTKTALGGPDPDEPKPRSAHIFSNDNGTFSSPAAILAMNHKDNGAGWCIGCTENGGSVPVLECPVIAILEENYKNMIALDGYRTKYGDL